MTKKRIIFFPLLSWNSSLLHRDQMLAKSFAKNNFEVIYLDRITRKPWEYFGKKEEQDSGLTVIKVFSLPYFQGKIPFIYTINDFLLSFQIKNIIKNNDLLYLSNPDWAFVFDKDKNNNTVIYDISDDFVELAKNKSWKNNVQKNQDRAIMIADRFVLTHKELLNDKVKIKPWMIVSNGIDQESFKKAKPAIERGKFEKIAGFIGGIYQWVDLGLIKKLAENFPEVLFVLAGPTNMEGEVRSLAKMNNVKYLGVIDKNFVGNYFSSLDIGLVPYVSEQKYPRLKSVDSNKIYQYLYFGYPVISTDFAQVRDLGSLVFVAKTEKEFVDCFKKALGEKINQERISYAKNQSWDKKVEEIINIKEI